MMKAVYYMLVMSLLTTLASQATKAQEFEANWKSLGQYECPDWYRDAKFGIFMHWGVCCTAENDGWYGRWMYVQEGARWGNAYEHHLQHFGHPSEFGYKDLIPLWTAEHWEPRELARFYKEIGAKYVVPVAVHHDNFDNYDSAYQPWNSVNLGPKRDVVGEWKEACEAEGLRFGVSSHSARAWSWFLPSHGSDVKGPKKGIPYDGRLTEADGKGTWWEGYNPQDLYCKPHGEKDPPSEEYKEKWFNRTKELLDKYQPDLLYFDGGIPLGDYGMRIAAHFYNANQQWHGGDLGAILNLKFLPDESAGVLDIECGMSEKLRKNPWQTDATVNPGWFYQKGNLVFTAPVLIDNLIDIVSKNGNLLLNVGLKRDGTLPEDQRKVLQEMGDWLKLNGEAIYGSRPWVVYGEGPTQVEKGHFKQRLEPHTADDIRFTTKGKTLYCILMDWPGEKVSVQSLGEQAALLKGKIKRFSLVGSETKIQWKKGEKALEVELPAEKPCEHAQVLKLELE